MGLFSRTRSAEQTPAAQGEAARTPAARDSAHADAETEAVRLIEQGNASEDAGRGGEALDLYEAAIRMAPGLARAHMNRGNALLAMGRTAESLEAYTAAIARDPGYAQAHYNLGNAHLRAGGCEAAIVAYREALVLKPDFAQAEAALGLAQQRAGRIDDAVATLRLLLERNPGDPAGHFNLGNALKQQGNRGDAIASYHKALAIAPDYANARFNLAVTLQELGRLDEAVEGYQRVLQVAPQFASAHMHLGSVLRELGRPQEAAASFRSAVTAAPGLAMAHCNLGNMQRELGHRDEAVASYRQALTIDPESADLHFNLGTALKELGRSNDAIASFSTAVRLQPDHGGAHTNLGSLYRDLGRLGEAEAHLRRAVESEPESAEAHNNLGNTLKSLRRFDEAIAQYRRALRIKPDAWVAHSNLLLAMNYAGTGTAAERLEAAKHFGRRVQASARPSAAPAPRLPRRPDVLRVGMVSGDFLGHPVGYFLQGLLRECGGRRLELFAYPTHDAADEMTAALRRSFSAWKPLTGLGDEAAAQMIRADGVHVLLDLSGHTARNRLPLFGWKPAPVQASWLGYFATTGIAEMDYVLGDPCVTPASEERQFTERIWRLPESYLCFTPPAVALAVGTLPALASGRVTFGCFNNLDKMNDEVVALWSRVLHAVAGSRLFLKTLQLADAGVRAETLRRFAAAGIADDRLVLEGPSPRADLLAAYGRVDIALDPFPYPGGTTTAEGYWMGVPAITRRGDRFLSRVGETIAHNVGLPDWIADDDDDYVAKAVHLASNRNDLAALRARLRSQALASPLFDARRFSGHFEAALWGMWESAHVPDRPSA
ncbi:MAG: tetratricopeptide repeat protein [Casimicrobiaceae bacterium]